MSYAADFENDVFISYAHIDDQPLVETESGWVANLHRALEVRLRQLLGADAAIWRDAKLTGNDRFGDALVNKFPAVALMVSVISPRYQESEWCQRELRLFFEAEKSRGSSLGDKSPVFKVVKTHVPIEQQSSEFQAVLGYEFYEVDQASQRPREFRQEAGANKDPRYWDKLEDLAYDLAEALKRLKSQDARPATGGGPAIYLAPTTSDLRDEHDMIKRELQQRGHPVLPDSPLPMNGPELQQAVDEYLEQCALSVHMIGRYYGLVPEAADRSVGELQNAVAARRSVDSGLRRLIWMPKGLEAQEERQRQLVDTLQTDNDALAGADLLMTDLGELKAAIQHSLSGGEKTAEPALDDDEPANVYVIYGADDFDRAAALEDVLFDDGFEVISPLIEGDEEEMAEDHQENLKRCDAAILYYGESGDGWFRSRLRELDAAGASRQRPMLAKAVYVAGAETRQKQRFRTRKAIVIKGPDDADPGDELEAFREAIREARRS